MESRISTIAFFCAFCMFSNCFAQDFIYNGSFEKAAKCPSSLLDFDNVSGWHIFRGTPDYFASCASKSKELGVPKNFQGTRSTFFGSSYAGISLVTVSKHLKGNAIYNSSESICTKTVIPLQLGRKYELIFWVSLTDSSYFSTESMYCSFSEFAPIKDRNVKGVMGWWNKFQSCDDFACNVDFETKGSWNKVVLRFQAKRNYNYLAIGLPRECYTKKQYLIDTISPRRKISATKWDELSAYYYIDNVSLVEK